MPENPEHILQFMYDIHHKFNFKGRNQSLFVDRRIPSYFHMTPRTLYLSGETSHCKWLSLSVLSSCRTSRRSLSRLTVSNAISSYFSRWSLFSFQLLCILPFCTNAVTHTHGGRALGTERPGVSARDELPCRDNNPQIPSLPSWLLSVLTSGVFMPTHYWRCVRVGRFQASGFWNAHDF